MHLAKHLLPPLIATLAAASGALAAEPEAVATAPVHAEGAAQVSVGDQIDNYLKTSPAVTPPRDGVLGVTAGADEPRKVHGFVDVAVGTGGYRSVYMRSDMPVGKTGTLSVAVGQTKFNGRGYGAYGGRFANGFGGGFGGGERQSIALGLSLGGSALDPHDPRYCPTGEDGPDGRYDPRFDGGRQRLCNAAGAPTSPQ